jgi:hypothetical protein
MNGLTLNAAGTNRIFRPNGKVVVADTAGKDVAKGEWRSVTGPEANRLHYTFESEDHEIDVGYSFNAKNQLVAVIPAKENGGQDSPPWVFPGRIVIHETRDIIYELLSDEGDETGKAIAVHAKLRVADTLDQLVVALPDGSSTQIHGGEPGSTDNFTVGRNDFKAGVGADTIQFQARTTNTFDGTEYDEPARISFVGGWDLNGDGLVFHAEVANGAVAIQLGGSYKGITAGLAYYVNKGDTTAAFHVSGYHHFQSGSAEGSANWLLVLGYSNKKLQGSLDLDGQLTTVNGNQLRLAGRIQFAGQEMSLQVEAKCNLGKDGQLIFRADIANDKSINYNLMLEGKYRVRGGNVDFLVKLGNKDNTNTVTVDLSATFSNDKIKAHLSALLRQTETGKMDLQLSFDVSVRFVAGQLIKPSEPVPIGAGTN